MARIAVARCADRGTDGDCPIGLRHGVGVDGSVRLSAAGSSSGCGLRESHVCACRRSDLFLGTLVDVVDDYFPIEHEEPVRMIGNGLSEGSITTVAQVSPTIFEPWRRDTGDRDQRDENTVQTMRRYAKVRVTPPLQGGGGFWVEIAVFKDLEDNAHPQHATAGAATLRYDSTLTGVVNPVVGDSITLGWINKGRDTVLEQIMIGHLLSRCGQVGVPAMAASPQAGEVTIEGGGGGRRAVSANGGYAS